MIVRMMERKIKSKLREREQLNPSKRLPPIKEGEMSALAPIEIGQTVDRAVSMNCTLSENNM